MKQTELIKKLKERFDSNGARLNYIQDVVDTFRKSNKKEVESFFIQLNRESDECEGEDGWIIGGEYFDWKEFENTEVLEAMLCLVERKFGPKLTEEFYIKAGV